MKLYHNTNFNALYFIMEDGYISTRAEHKGEDKSNRIWLTNKYNDVNGQVKISIEIPDEWENTEYHGYRTPDGKMFYQMNEAHYTYEHNIGVRDYNFAIEKIGPYNLYDLGRNCKVRTSEGFNKFMNVLCEYEWSLSNESFINDGFILQMGRQFGVLPLAHDWILLGFGDDGEPEYAAKIRSITNEVISRLKKKMNV